MPDEPRTTLEVDFGCGPDRFGTMPSIGYRMVDAIDPQGLRAVLESGRIKVVFVAHSALYFTPTCTEESGAEVEFDVSEFWKFASREYVRWRLEPSRAPENIGGFTWAMDFVYPRYAAPRSDVMANLCKFASGGWMPDEVYGPVVP